jgi:hypothetical protein
MKIVAFMQCQWFHEPEKILADMARMASDPERGPAHAEKYRRRLIHYALFAGCKSGKMLRKVFGKLCDDIVWEEASREIGGHSRAAFPADLAHIRKVLEDEKPDVVLALGKIAEDGVRLAGARWSFPCIMAPHPAARGLDTLHKLQAARRALDRTLTAPKIAGKTATFMIIDDPCAPTFDTLYQQTPMKP